MDYNKLLIEYIKEKRNLIQSITGGNYLYCTKKDLNDVSRWSQDTCADILCDLAIGAIKSCPWCSKYTDKYNHQNCQDCEYQVNNKKCSSPNSRFKKLSKLPIKFFISKDLLDLINKYNITK